MHKLTLLSLFSLSVLSGCATTIDLTPKERQEVHTIAIDPKVSVTDQMSFYGDGMQIFAGFGLAGMMVEASIANQDSKKIIAEQEQNHVSPDQDLVQIMTQALNATSSFKVVNTEPDAVMTLAVTGYGLMAQKMGFSLSKLGPMITISAKLTRDHQIIWQHREIVPEWACTTPGYSMDELHAHPEYLKEMWDAVTLVAVKKLVQDLVNPAQTSNQ